MKLLSRTERPVLISPQNKDYWCEVGAKVESNLFGKHLSGCAFMANQGKAVDKYAHDGFILKPADIKTIRTRFETADRYGIPSRSAFTLNRKDLLRYKELYPLIDIIFDIDYGDYKTIRIANLREINAVVKDGRAKLHTYQHRVNDTAGNAKESYVLDAEWFMELK